MTVLSNPKPITLCPIVKSQNPTLALATAHLDSLNLIINHGNKSFNFCYIEHWPSISKTSEGLV